ncbi:RNA-directed DNA polymerase, eukaryota [Tanacetum coccineum]
MAATIAIPTTPLPSPSSSSSHYHHSTFVPFTTAIPPSSSSSCPTAETATTRGAGPIGRLGQDSFEAKAEWWVSSRAFFDGRICEPPQIPPAVRNDIYQRVDEQDRSIKELKQHNVDQYKILNNINKHFEGMNAFCTPGPMKAPVEVLEDFGLSDFSGFQNTEASRSFFEGAQMTLTYPGSSHIGTLMAQLRFASCFSRYHPSHPDTLHIRTPMAQPGFASCYFWYPLSHPGTPYIGTPLALQGLAPWSSNYQAGPSHNRDVVRVNPKNNEEQQNLPFDLGKAGIDLNEPLEEEVMVTGSRATDEYLSFHNVDPNKVMRGRYVDCMRFLNESEYVYLDGYTVGLQFWQELDPLLCKGGYYKHQKFSEVGWLSDDQINCWMELIIRARPPGARYTVAKTRMASLHLGTHKFILETDEHIIRMLDGSSSPYPSWDDVDIVYMPLHCNGNLSDCGVVTCWVIENLCSNKAPVVDGDPNLFLASLENMASRFYACSCEDTSQCGYD